MIINVSAIRIQAVLDVQYKELQIFQTCEKILRSRIWQQIVKISPNDIAPSIADLTIFLRISISRKTKFCTRQTERIYAKKLANLRIR